jgi:3-oxoacyl-[acyl-carrier protein] reductase
MGKLAGKTALVTGAGRGIGRGIARRLAADGAHVAVNYSRAAAAAESLVDEIKAAGGNAFAVKADITSLDAISGMFAELAERFGKLNILVNNAGLGSAGLPSLADTTEEAFDALFALNAKAVFFVTQAAARMLADGGRIINISSTSTRARYPGLSAYAGSKIAVEAYTRVWAMELAKRQITVNSVLPGIVDTDLISHMSEDRKQRSVQSVPLGRIGKPEDIADVVAFLASDDARWVTGQEIVASGGN